MVATPLLPSRQRMTEAEFLRLPDDGKYELIDGVAVKVPATHQHDYIGAIFIYRLTPASIGIGYLAGSQAGFRMTAGNIRCPDVSFMLKSRLPQGVPAREFADGAPDLCIEIISDSEIASDMAKKRTEYFASGAQIIWQVYPESQSIRIYTDETTYIELTAADEISGAHLLPKFRVPVASLFTLE